jgi:prevent-host-death family protein
MTTVSVSHLKSRLSQYLAMVKEGGEVLVTERGRPIARLVPERPSRWDDERIAELRRKGVLRGNPRPLGKEFFELPRGEDPEGAVLKALLEEREEGY